MKKIILATIVALTLFSCSKSDDDNTNQAPTFATAPETKPEFDGTAYGVYKGLLLDGDQSLKVVIRNGNDIAKIYIYEEGVEKDVLSTNYTFTAGSAITSANFSSAQASMDFSVNADGTNPTIENINMASMRLKAFKRINRTGILKRETSDKLVYVYQGRYTSDVPQGDSGRFKCMIIGDEFEGYVTSSDGNSYTASAGVTDNSFSAVFGNVSSGASFQGLFTPYACQGSWSNAEEEDYGGFFGGRSL